MSWVELSIWIFYVQENVCADWTLNSLLYLYLVLRCFLIVLSVDYTCVFWNWLWKNYFSANFPQVSDFQCEVFGRIYSYVQTRVVLPYADVAIAHPVRISIGLRLASLSLPYTHLCIFIDLSWHLVCFSRGFLPRFWHFFAHLFSSHDLHCVFCYSFKSLCF
jgi:hypothetical protein